jgi:hypothetical protein
MLTRVGEARDWGTGLPLKASLLGKMNKLEVHHIFPKARLYAHGYGRPDVNAVANFCFLTKDTNLRISDRLPEVYFAEVEQAHPGALASQWIPMDRELWTLDRYPDFLAVRRQLLADAANDLLRQLLHGEIGGTAEAPPPAPRAELRTPTAPTGGVESPEEEEELLRLQAWLDSRGLPPGALSHEIADPDSGAPLAILDLAWPDGLQPGYSRPVAVLLNESKETLEAAETHGFSFFTSVASFRAHVLAEVLGEATENPTP